MRRGEERRGEERRGEERREEDKREGVPGRPVASSVGVWKAWGESVTLGATGDRSGIRDVKE